MPNWDPISELGTRGLMEAPRSRLGSDAVDEILRETLRRRAPPSLSVTRDNWRNPMSQFRARQPDHDRGGDTHSSFNNQQQRDRMDSARGQTAGFAHAIDVLRRDGLSSSSEQQFIERFQRDRSQESRRSTLWGDIDDYTEG